MTTGANGITDSTCLYKFDQFDSLSGQFNSHTTGATTVYCMVRCYWSDNMNLAKMSYYELVLFQSISNLWYERYQNVIAQVSF